MTCNHEKNSDSSNKNIVLALVAGAGAGLAAGLLMAPKSGEKLRAEIGDAVNDYMDTARKSADELKTSAGKLVERGRDDVRKGAEVAAGAIRGMVSSAVETGSKDAHEAISRTEKSVHNGAVVSHVAVNNATEAMRAKTQA